MTTIQQYLQSYFNIKATQTAAIADLFRVHTLAKGEYYIKENQYNIPLSFIEQGHLRVFNYQAGKEITQWIATQGELVTDLSGLLFDQAARWNIQALTDCQLLTINAHDYHRIHERIPEWHQLEKLFIAKCFLTLEDRVYSFLSLTAEERYLHFFAHKPELLNQVPLLYIASMLGMTPETLSRIRKKMTS